MATENDAEGREIRPIPIWDTNAVIDVLENGGMERAMFWALCERGFIHLPAPVVLELRSYNTTAAGIEDRDQVVATLGQSGCIKVPSQAAFSEAGLLMRSYKNRNKATKENHKIDCLIAAMALELGLALVTRDGDFTHLSENLPRVKGEATLLTLYFRAQLDLGDPLDI